MADQYDVQHSILDIQSKRSKLGIKKQQLQGEISKIREMLKFVQQGHETFEELVLTKNKLIAETHEIDSELIDLKDQIKRCQLLKDELNSNEQPKTTILEFELTTLRDRYLSFAGDRSRIGSMRAMAAEFASELTKLIKKSKIIR